MYFAAKQLPLLVNAFIPIFVILLFGVLCSRATARVREAAQRRPDAVPERV